MEGKSAPPVMIPMSRSSRDYRASKHSKVSSDDTSSASKKSQIRASGSPSRSAPATKKAKTGGSSALLEQNRSTQAIETTGRSDSAKQPPRPASSRSKRAADVNGDVTLDALRPSKKSKIRYSLKNGEACAEVNDDSLISKNVKTEGLRKKQASGTAAPSRTPEASSSDNALNALKLPKSVAGSAGAPSVSEETNALGGSVHQISEGAVNAVGSSEPPELTEQRSLRPRPKPPVSKKVVKRTRFHEVSLGDSDGPRIVGRRIKVFWPLDKKWYYGSVKAYNGVKKQHKIIYDDHDEEWLKLQKESFRLEVLSGDSFGFAAPSSDLADLADLVASTECDEISKHRGDIVDASTSASDDKLSEERTGVRRSKAGKENERKRKSEGSREEKKKLDGTNEQKKKAGRGTDKKKLEGDMEPKKKVEEVGDRGKKLDATRGVGRKRGDVKQKATSGEKLGRGSAKRAVLEVYERRKKRTQVVGTSGLIDRKGKRIVVSDGLTGRRKRTGKETNRRGSTSQARPIQSASETTEGKKSSRRGIRDNDRLFASIKSPSAVLRRKVAEGRRGKESKPAERTQIEVDISQVGAPEDEEKVFSHPQAGDARPLEFQEGREERRGEVADAASKISTISLERTNFLQERDIGGSPGTSTADVTEVEDAACEEPDSLVPVSDSASDDKVLRNGCRDETLSFPDSVPRELIIVRDDVTEALCGEQVAGEVVRQRDTDSSEIAHLGGKSQSEAECVDSCKEGVQQTGNDTVFPTLQAVESRFEVLPSILEESSKQEVFLDGPLYFGVGLEGPRYLNFLRISALGTWSMLRDGTLQLGTYFGVPGVLSLLRVSRRLLRLFLTTITQSKTLVGFSSGEVEHSAEFRGSDCCLGEVTESKFTDEVSSGRSFLHLGVLPPRTGRPGPLRRRIIVSFHPYLRDPLREFKLFSPHQFLKEPNGINRRFQRLFTLGSRIPRLKIEYTTSRVVTSRITRVQELPLSFCRDGEHLPTGRQIVPGDVPSGSNGAEVVPLSHRWIVVHTRLKQICSASSFFNVQRSSGPALLDAALEAARREFWMVKFPVTSAPHGKTWDNPRGWGCREVGAYYGRRSLRSLLRASVGELCVGCSSSSSSFSFSSSSSASWDDGWQLAVILVVVRDVYGFCKKLGFGVAQFSGRDSRDLVRGLLRNLLADRAMPFHLARVWGWKVVADLQEIADYYDGLPGEREIQEIAYELIQLFNSRSFHRMAENWENVCVSQDPRPLVNDVEENDCGVSGRGEYRENLEFNPAVNPRFRRDNALEDLDPSTVSNSEVPPHGESSDRRPPDASGSCIWIPRPLLSPQEMSVRASTLSTPVRRPRLSLASPFDRRVYFRKASSSDGTALPVGMGATTQEVPPVFVVLDKASFAAANPVLMFSSGSRNLPEVYPRTSMRRCTDLGTYVGLPSIESFLRISKDFWRRIFYRPKVLEEENNVRTSNLFPVVDERPIAGFFPQLPEPSSVDTIDTEELSDLDYRLQVTSAERYNVGGSSEGKESNENSTGEGLLETPLESLSPLAMGDATGKGLKRDFMTFSADAGDASGAKAECPSDGDTVSEKPLSKRTRAYVDSSCPAVFAENGVETSSPSSDVDGNGCTVPPLAAEQKTEESALPRVNVLKLRRCPTNKGLWRVAGNSCTPAQEKSNSGRALEVRESGEGAELMTPVLELGRKRGLSHCSETPLAARNDQSGTSVLTSTYSSSLTECSPRTFDQELPGAIANRTSCLDSKPKEVWYDCGMTYINDVPDGLEPRKRRRKGPSPPTHSDEVEAVPEHSLRRSADSVCVPCVANVLSTRSDRCVRETGAVVELQSGHGNTWMLSVTLNGETKYTYKADQPVATGTSNKFTHAMMWRGGKDWSLEFVDRKQWQLFKDLHDECFQRTARAATVRHIPIPGVKQIPDAPRTGMRFVRPYGKYIHQNDAEVEAALTSSRVIYDMDSEDEDWLTLINSEKVTPRGGRSRPRIDEDTLERVIDKLEKISFLRSQQEPLISSEVAAEVCQALSSEEVIKAIHAYWYDKRTRKGMALVRHFQPAPWEQYQKLLEDWQSRVNQLQQESPTANKQQLQATSKRPPLFAFCLRPRGLENRNKMQKQRSQRKLGGSSSRQWTLAGPASDFFLDSPSKRPAHLESSSGSFYGSRKYARQRIEESINYAEPVPVDLTDSFNALASGDGFTSSGGTEQVIPTGVGATFSQVDSSPLTRTGRTPTTRPHKRKAGRKARKMRLLASAEESRRKRQLRAHQGHVKERFLDAVRSPHSLTQLSQPLVDKPSTSTLSFPHSEDADLEATAIAKAAAAKLARETATAKRARAQALYAVADAAMHKAVAAVIAADAIHASERAMEEAAAMLGKEVDSPEQTGEVPVKDEGSRTRLRTPVMEGGTSFGSWRRALNSASRNANHLLSKGTSSKQGLMPDTDDPLLPVASWSQELGAGLGTRLLQTGEVSPQRQRYSPVLGGLSKSPTRGVVNLGRTRGESMMAMLTR